MLQRLTGRATNVQGRRIRRAALCVAVASLSTLAACGDDDDSSSSATTASNPTATGSPSSTSGATGPTTTVAPVKVSLQTFQGSMFELAYAIADNQGFFAKNGIDAKMSYGAGQPAMLAAVASGQVDLVATSVDAVLLAGTQGAKLEIVAGAAKAVGMFVVSPRVPKTTGTYPQVMKALEGRTIGANVAGGTAERMWKTMFSDGGVTDFKMAFVGAAPTAVAAMKAGQIDAFFADPLSSKLFEREVPGAWILTDNLTGGPSVVRGQLQGVWSSTNEWVKSNPDTAKAFVKSIAQAVKWAQDDANVTALAELVSQFALAAPDKTQTDLARTIRARLAVAVPVSTVTAWGQFSEIKIDDPARFLSVHAPQTDAAVTALLAG